MLNQNANANKENIRTVSRTIPTHRLTPMQGQGGEVEHPEQEDESQPGRVLAETLVVGGAEVLGQSFSFFFFRGTSS